MNNTSNTYGACCPETVPHTADGGIRFQGAPGCTAMVPCTVHGITGSANCGEPGELLEDGSVRCPAHKPKPEAKPKDLPLVWGGLYKHRVDGTVAILAKVSPATGSISHKFNLVCLHEANRWNDPDYDGELGAFDDGAGPELDEWEYLGTTKDLLVPYLSTLEPQAKPKETKVWIGGGFL